MSETKSDSVAVEAMLQALAEPFAPEELKYKPAVVSGQRALALVYIDARVVQDRLDDVLGPQNWQDEYEFLGDGSVVCRLRVRLSGEWIVKMDVGGPSEQPDEGDRRKAAVSDALKRAAVKWGVGRYLYRLPQAWVDYDPQKKQLKSRPQLPAWAMPSRPRPPQQVTPAAPSARPQPAAPKPAGDKLPDPATGADLEKWLAQVESRSGGAFRPGELHSWSVGAMRLANSATPLNMINWTPALVKTAVGLVKTRFRERKAELEAIAQVRKQIDGLLADAGVSWGQAKDCYQGEGPCEEWPLEDWEETLKRLKEWFEDVEVM